MKVPKLHCFIHNFSTWSISDWDKHCYETGHKIEGYKNGKAFSTKYPKDHMHRQSGFIDDIREHIKFAKLLESFDGIKRTNI